MTSSSLDEKHFVGARLETGLDVGLGVELEAGLGAGINVELDAGIKVGLAVGENVVADGKSPAKAHKSSPENVSSTRTS